MKFLSTFTILIFFLANYTGLPQASKHPEVSSFLLPTLEPIIPDFQVNEDGGSVTHTNASVAICDNGSFLIVWQDEREERNVYYTPLTLYGRVFSSTGIPKGPEFKINEAGYVNFTVPKAVRSIGNQFFVVWSDNRNGEFQDFDIYAQRVSADGNLLEQNFKVNDGPFLDTYGYPVVTGAGNNVIVVWEDTRTGTLYPNPNIYMQAFDSLGNPKGSNIRVDDDPAIGRHERPFADASPDGSWFAVWQDSRGGIFGQRFSEMNQKIGGNFLINDTTNSNVDPHIAMGSNGTAYVTWHEWQLFDGKGRFYLRIVDSTNSFSGPEILINDNSSVVRSWESSTALSTNLTGRGLIAWNGDNSKIFCRGISSTGVPEPDIIQFTDSIFFLSSVDLDYSENFGVLVWEELKNNFLEIYARRMDLQGYPIGNKFKINSDSLNGYHGEPDIAMSPNGSYMITWEDERNASSDIFTQRFSSEHNRLEENLQLAGPGGLLLTPDVGIQSNGGFVITYTSYQDLIQEWDIYMERFDPSGQQLGTTAMIGGMFDDLPQITVLPSDEYLIVWDGYGGIRGKFFNTDGAFINEITLWDGNISSGQSYPSVVSNSNGKILVIWSDNRRGYLEIFGQELNEDRQKVGSNFLISDSFDTNDKYYPKIGIDETGAFITAWSQETDSLNYNIHVRYFDSSNHSIGSSFVVNEDTLNSGHRISDVAMEVDGRAVIVWQEPELNGEQILGQRFSVDREKFGQNFQVNLTGDLSDEIKPSVALYDSSIITAWMSNNSPFGNYNIWANVLNYNSPVSPPPPQITRFKLFQNYPNPFNAGTTIRYHLPHESRVKIVIHNIVGQKVTVLIDNELQPADEYFLKWEPKNLASGVYLLTLSAGDFYEVRKMIYLK